MKVAFFGYAVIALYRFCQMESSFIEISYVPIVINKFMIFL